MLDYKKKINKLFYIFITAHLIIWTLIPSLTNKNLPLDTIEALAWGSNLDWGFNKHPPASAFFLEFFYQIFGPRDWAYYLLSQIFVVLSFVIVFKFANELLKNKSLSLISILLLEGIYFYNFTTPEFNVNVCQLPFWALSVYYSWKLYNNKKIEIKDCFYLGIFAAIGFLSKYLFIYLLLAIDLLFFYIIFIKKRKKFDFKYFIALEVFIVLMIPHLIWLTNNDYVTITYGLARTGLENSNLLDHLIYPLLFLIKQIGILIPFFILLFLLLKKFKFNISLKDNRLLFLLTINLIPIFLIFLTSVITGSKIRTMWMTPFYLFFGVMFVYIFQSQIKINNLKRFGYTFLFLFFFLPSTYGFISLIKTDKRTDYPGKQISQKVLYEWNKNYKDPINVVLGREWSAGNLSYHLKSRPVWIGFVTKDKLESLSQFICINKQMKEPVCVGRK